MDAASPLTRINDRPAGRRTRGPLTFPVAAHAARMPIGPRGSLAEIRAAREVAMLPDQLEGLARIAYAALAEYDEVQGEPPWPRWSCAPETERRRMLAKIRAHLRGHRVAAGDLAGLQLVDLRRYRLFDAVIAAATAAA